MKSIIYMTWFGGPLPAYFGEFVKCANRLDNERFVVLSDSVDDAQRGNVRTVSCSLAQVAERMEDIGIEIPMELSDPRKPCDWRPLLAELFPEYVSHGDYWGWCDFDIVLGSFRILHQAMQDGYDVISTATGIVNGPLTLLRNNEYCRTLYRQHANWQELIAAPELAAFDEIGMTQVVLDAHRNGKLRLWAEYCHSHSGQDKRSPIASGLRQLSDGKLLDTIQRREVVFFHFPHWDWWPSLCT